MNEEAIEELVLSELERIRSTYVDDGRVDQLPSALMLHRVGKDGKKVDGDKYATTFMVIAGEAGGDYAQVLREQAWANDAVFVCLALEIWTVDVPMGASQELKDEVAAAQAAGRLHQVDKTLLRERVRVHVESEWTPHRWFDAVLTRGENGKVSLSTWEELQIRLPRPGFKRYLPERVDGKRILKVGFLPSGIQR